MSEVYYSVSSHRKIVHMSSCSVLKRIEKERIRTFDNMEEAWLKGYHLCRCCSPLVKKYREEKAEIAQFCAENGFYTYFEYDKFYIISGGDQWLLFSDGVYKKIRLYHRNTEKFRKGIDRSIIPGYHPQAHESKKIIGFLQYIKGHDEFRFCYVGGIKKQKNIMSVIDTTSQAKKKKPKKKSQKKKLTKTIIRKRRRRQRRSMVSIVYALFDMLESSYNGAKKVSI